uniref:Uncharacterized protein n=1 Tax=Lepeophtheirus salmonis TaxID=72036 RepID=A0A0K2TRN1_LEPSM
MGKYIRNLVMYGFNHGRRLGFSIGGGVVL